MTEERVVTENPDAVECVITTKSGHEVSCTASRRRGDDIMLVVSIDGMSYSYGDSRMDEDASLYGEARQEARTVASMVEAGKLRRTETGWDPCVD
jgi:hypothetical protein